MHIDKHKLKFITLACILAASIASAAIFWSGPYYQTDDIIYLRSAFGILSHQYVLQPGYAELLTIMSIVLSFKIVGFSTFTAVLPMLISFAGIVGVIFLLGEKLYGYWFGLISAYLAMSASFVLPYATRALPDMTSAFSASLGIYLFMLALEGKKLQRKKLFASGIMMGLSPGFKTSEGLLILGIFIIAAASYYAYTGLHRKRKPNGRSAKITTRILRTPILYIIVGAIIPLAFISAYFNFSTGNPFFNIISANLLLAKNSGGGGQSTLSQNIASLDLTFNPLYYYMHPNLNLAYYAQQQQPLGLLVLLAIAGAALGIVKRNKEIIFLSIIGMFCLFYLIIGSQSYKIYTFIQFLPRFFTIIILPLSIAGAYPLMLLFNYLKAHKHSRAAMLAVVSIIVMSTAFNIPVYTEMFYFSRSTANIGQVFSAAINSAASAASPSIIYVAVPDANYIITYLELLTHNSNSIVLEPVQTSTCNPDGKNEFLVEVNGNIQDASTLQNYINGWIDNCTITEISSNITRWAQASGNITLYSQVYKISR